MANICATNYVIEGEKKELDALYQKMKELQGQDLGLLVKALGKNPDEMECRGEWTELVREDETLRMIFETAWTPCYEVTQLMKAVYPSLRIFYKAEEPGCEVYLKNDAEGKYFPETEADGHPFKLMTGEDENEQIRLIRAIQEGKIKLEPKK
ncbi:hypothetical protein SAMN04487902_10980 [Prevotella sp. ne3005]|uniref:hypothetical protein n=1 Tax=Prevotella sp. ne3005 TaxID=1761887 RepID=UPI0008D2FF09|nr:hypothetical protein [Prevotella sp. ne3005]SEN24095.1 hypothetical protein SAMN04487902_10980 [Prevotella sp. ne3005]